MTVLAKVEGKAHNLYVAGLLNQVERTRASALTG
jgi:hypothetical protein